MSGALGPRNTEVRRLRSLLRDSELRRAERRCVLEGPRPILGALDRSVQLEKLFLGPGADQAFSALVERIGETGTEIVLLKADAIERISTTRSPQPILGLAELPILVTDIDKIDNGGTLVVAIGINDPGNLGTILRSAEASGAVAVMSCGSAVDFFNPKVMRSSAGAIFGIPLLEIEDSVTAVKALAPKWNRVGTYVDNGERYDAVNLHSRCAVIFGNEAHGLPKSLEACIDQRMTIPLAGGAESLNVAMAVSVVCFEAARQRSQNPIKS